MYGSVNAYSTQVSDPGLPHSTVQIAAESADGKQIVEIGITVDNQLNGSSSVPYLFVDAWVDGVNKCFNTCGFVRVTNADPAPHTPFVNLSSHRLAIQHFGGNWWVGDWYSNPTSSTQHGGWIGYYPDSVWGGRFTRTGLVQWFGEVEASTSTPCADMGNGQFAGNSSAAIGGLGIFNGPAVNYFVQQTNRSYYTVGDASGNFFRYGGPGAC
jgi:hypothetical protein